MTADDLTEPTTDPFADLLTANRRYADGFTAAELPGVARAGVAIVTCMDARIDPLAILGLSVGDAKVLRNAGGRVDDPTLTALVLAVNLLDVDRILVVEHTRCAMGSATAEELRSRIAAASGGDASGLGIETVDDQEAAIRADVARTAAHPLIGTRAAVGGFRYDVATGLLHRVA